MAAMAGILASPSDWWSAGSLPTPIPIPTLLAIQAAVFAFLEAQRYESWKKTGAGGALGGKFDPAGMDSPEMRVKEVKNGRLAMLAVLGCASVHAVRGLAPLDALKLHISNPFVENIFSTSVATEFCVFISLVATVPMFIAANETLNKSKKPFKSAIPF
jgi:hypothetical protein